MEGELTQNDQAALAGVFEDSYGQVVSYFARRLDNDTAQDAAALVFAKLASAVEQGNTDPARLLPLIVNEVAWKGARDAARRREEPAGLAADIAELLELGIARPLTYAEHRFTADFDIAIRALEDETRDAFILTELRGTTTREAGVLLDTSHMTIARRTERARTRLQEALTD